MEKEPQVRQAETVMNRAATDVQQVIAEYADAAFFHACKMTEQGKENRAAMITNGDATITDSVISARTLRVSRISDFRQDAQCKISASGLTPENAKQAHTWLATKLSNCAVIETKASHSISDKAATSIDSILSVEESRQDIIDSQLTQMANHLKQNAFSTNWNSFFQYVTNKTKHIENMLDADKDVLSNRIRTKHQEVKTLIAVKSGQQENLIYSYDAQLKNLLDRLSAKQSQQEPNQRQTKPGGQQQQSNRQSGNTNRSPRAEDPRIKTLMGKDGDSPKRPYKIVLVNIDHHRKKDKSDAEIYRLLVKHFHPDKSEHDHAEAIIRILTSSYDSKNKRFVI